MTVTHVPPGPPPPPPPRRRRWWGWCIGCCGGCSVVAIILGVIAFQQSQSAMESFGPINEAAVVQRLGSDVPRYPNSVFDETNTRAGSASAGITQRLIDMGGGSDESRRRITAVGSFGSGDEPEKVAAWYDREMAKRGWRVQNVDGTRGRQRMMGILQRFYSKSNRGMMIQLQPGPKGGTIITLMRLEGSPSPEGATPPGGGSRRTTEPPPVVNAPAPVR